MLRLAGAIHLAGAIQERRSKLRLYSELGYRFFRSLQFLFGSRLKFVQAIQRSDLVGFRQRGIVEYCIAEILDARSQGENDLADVNDFRRPIANRVHPKQFQRIRDQKISFSRPWSSPSICPLASSA